MAEKTSENPKKSSKTVNLLDQQAVKNIWDESVCEIVKGRGYVEDVRLSNVRILLGTVIIVIALVAQFYKKKFKFPENNYTLIGCIVSYVVLNILLQLLTYTKKKNALLFTFPPWDPLIPPD